MLPVLAVLLCLGVGLPRLADAQGKPKWNVTTAFNAYFPPAGIVPPGPQINQSPYNIDPSCTNVGTCTPYKFALPARTLWYWCGWSTTQRTDLDVTAQSSLVSVQIMTASILNSCGLPNVAGISACGFVFGSQNVVSLNTPGTTYSVTQRVLGLVWSDEACMIVANNALTTQQISIQVFQYWDSPRYLGTIFTIIYVIMLIGGVCGYIGWTCYKELTQPIDRLAELSKFESQLIACASVVGDDHGDRDDDNDDKNDPGTFKGRVQNALSKAKNLVMRKKPVESQA